MLRFKLGCGPSITVFSYKILCYRMCSVDEVSQQIYVIDVVVQVLLSRLKLVKLLNTVIEFGDVRELELLHEQIGGDDLEVQIIRIGTLVEQITLQHECIGVLLFIESDTEITPGLLHFNQSLISLLNFFFLCESNLFFHGFELSQLLG